MPEIPSFLNKIDFYGRLLPGYVILVTASFLFKNSSTIMVPVASGDLSFSVVFIIAGAGLGYTLCQAERLIIQLLRNINASRGNKKSEAKAYLNKYVQARLVDSADKKLELDDVIAQYDFNASLSLGFYGLVLLEMVLKQVVLAGGLFACGTFFLIAAWQSTKGVHRYVETLSTHVVKSS